MTETFETDLLVIGAGVVGLAVARAFAATGREVIIAEAAEAIGTGVSSRHSEVIHAGLYYPQDSLKARHCVRGKGLLYEYADRHGIAHRRCGKIILATDDSQIEKLVAIERQSIANGVTDLSWRDEAGVRALEPQIRAVAALHSPSTGIIDSHGFMLSLLGELETAGGMLAYQTPVIGGEIATNHIQIELGGSQRAFLRAGAVINAAGHAAPSLLDNLAGFPKAHRPASYFAKGNYFALAGPPPFQRLVYPVPVPGGLGVHATLDLAGRVRFGPDVEWVDGCDDFDVDPARADSFYEAVRCYWPGLADGALVPDYAGVRPKLHGPDTGPADFVIDGPAQHGVPGLINLLGIESPGLTASLSIAEACLALID